MENLISHGENRCHNVYRFTRSRDADANARHLERLQSAGSKVQIKRIHPEEATTSTSRIKMQEVKRSPKTFQVREGQLEIRAQSWIVAQVEDEGRSVLLEVRYDRDEPKTHSIIVNDRRFDLASGKKMRLKCQELKTIRVRAGSEAHFANVRTLTTEMK